MPFMWFLFAQHLLPGNFSCRAINREHCELKRCRWRTASTKATASTSRAAGTTRPAATAPTLSLTLRRRNLSTATGCRGGLLQAGKLRNHIQPGLGLLRNRDCGLHKNQIVPHNRRSVTFTGDRNLPLHVLAFTPLNRRIGFRRKSVL